MDFFIFYIVNWNIGVGIGVVFKFYLNGIFKGREFFLDEWIRSVVGVECGRGVCEELGSRFLWSYIWFDDFFIFVF